MPKDPRSPRHSHRRWQHQRVPEREHLINIDKPSHVFLGPLPKNLLIYPSTVDRIVQVVQEWGTAPANVARQLHPTAPFFDASVIHIVGYGYGTCCRAELLRTGAGHGRILRVDCVTLRLRP